MELTSILLVWSVNLITGIGLVLLGLAMARRPERVWVGVRVARDPQELARIRRANAAIGPWILTLGVLDMASGLLALLGLVSPLTLAAGGLATLLLAIVALIVSAFLSR